MLTRYVGYKLRESISKNIKARSKAIGTAVKNYNQAARSVTPPAPTVDFATLIEWTELQEFDLLRIARRGDIRDCDWTKPIHRAIATKHYKVLRAHEELLRCQVKARRLSTFMRDEDAELTKKHEDLSRTKHPLTADVKALLQHRALANAVHQERFAKLVKLPGFKQAVVPGTRLGACPSSAPAPDTSSTAGPSHEAPTASSAVPQPAPFPMQHLAEGDDDEEMDEQEAEQIGALQDYLTDLDDSYAALSIS